jgi:hypothetical protein
LNDTETETCSGRVVDYINAQWELQRLRKTIDDSFMNFDLVALPTMRVLPSTIDDALAREENVRAERGAGGDFQLCPVQYLWDAGCLRSLRVFRHRSPNRPDDCRTALFGRQGFGAGKCLRKGYGVAHEKTEA